MPNITHNTNLVINHCFSPFYREREKYLLTTLPFLSVSKMKGKEERSNESKSVSARAWSDFTAISTFTRRILTPLSSAASSRALAISASQ